MLLFGKRGRIVAKKRSPAPPCPPNGLLPDEKGDLRKEAADVVTDAGQWLDLPNDQLGGQRSKDLIGTNREQVVRDLLRAIKQGMPT